MKYSKILLGAFIFFGLGIVSSCDVNDEFYDELDKADAKANEEYKFYSDKTLIETGYTLTDDDYALSSNEDVVSHKNFSSSVSATDYLTEILTNKMLYGEATVEYSVMYNYYRGGLSYVYDLVDYKDAVSALDSYELIADDYDGMGTESGEPGSHDNFSGSTPAGYYLPAFLLAKYADAENGASIYLTYKYWDNGLSEINEFWTFDGTTWAVDIVTALPEVPEVPGDVVVHELSADDYDSMGAPGSHDNFSSSLSPDDYLATFLSINYAYANEAGDRIVVLYKYYAGGGVTENKADVYDYDGSKWAEYERVVEASSLVAFKDRAWVVIPPIKLIKSENETTLEYTVIKSDYVFVGDTNYENFYVKGMSAEEADASIMGKLTKIIKNNFELAIGDVYEMSYNYYDGAATQEGTMTLEAVEDN